MSSNCSKDAAAAAAELAAAVALLEDSLALVVAIPA